MALVEEAGAGAGAGADDPEALLNEWLGELTVLTAPARAPRPGCGTWDRCASTCLACNQDFASFDKLNDTNSSQYDHR